MSVGIRGTDEFTGSHDLVNISQNKLHIAQYVWDTDTLSWIRQSGSTGGVATDVAVTNLPSVYRATKAPYAKRYDEPDVNTAYYGEATVGSFNNSPVWKIKKLTISGNTVVSIQYADGNTNYDNTWDNRYSLSYS